MRAYPSQEEEGLRAVIFGPCPRSSPSVPRWGASLRVGHGHAVGRSEVDARYAITASSILEDYSALFDESQGVLNAILAATAAMPCLENPPRVVRNVVEAEPEEVPEEDVGLRTLPELISTLTGLRGRIRVSATAAEYARRGRAQRVKIESVLEEEPE